MVRFFPAADDPEFPFKASDIRIEQMQVFFSLREQDGPFSLDMIGHSGFIHHVTWRYVPFLLPVRKETQCRPGQGHMHRVIPVKEYA